MRDIVNMRYLKYIWIALKKAVFNAMLSNPREAVRYYRREGVKIGDNTLLYSVIIDNKRPFLVSIGNNCTLTNCRLLTHDASMNNATGHIRVGNIEIGNNVFIGVASVVLPNVKIGDNVIVGAGTVVSKSIPENSVCAGNPMKIISTYDAFKEKHKESISKFMVLTDADLFSMQKNETRDLLSATGAYVKQ